jgi:hypothetical protein
MMFHIRLYDDPMSVYPMGPCLFILWDHVCLSYGTMSVHDAGIRFLITIFMP